jgi:hypothetical protein
MTDKEKNAGILLMLAMEAIREKDSIKYTINTNPNRIKDTIEHNKPKRYGGC